MEKKAYITPAFEVVSLNLTRVVLTTISGGDTKIVSSGNEEDDESYEQRSRRYDWSDDEW
jgi:hypothetical protein